MLHGHEHAPVEEGEEEEQDRQGVPEDPTLLHVLILVLLLLPRSRLLPRVVAETEEQDQGEQNRVGRVQDESYVGLGHAVRVQVGLDGDGVLGVVIEGGGRLLPVAVRD